jgi:ABC-type nitrate/sulfonate/bicarbonate transport system permease component
MAPAALAQTLGRLAAGFALGVLVGLPCGLLLDRLRGLRRLLEPLLSMLRLAPLLVLLPALLPVLGTGSAARVVVIAASCFLLSTLYTLDAVRSIDPAFVLLASNYGAGKLALLRRVYLPAVLPHIFTGLRLALATGWVITVSSELVEPQDGLGGMVMRGWRAATPEPLCVSILLSVVVAVALQAALLHFEAVLFPWRRSASRRPDLLTPPPYL